MVRTRSRVRIPVSAPKEERYPEGCLSSFRSWARDRTCLKGTVRGGAATKGAKRLLSRYQLQKKKGTRKGVPVREYKKTKNIVRHSRKAMPYSLLSLTVRNIYCSYAVVNDFYGLRSVSVNLLLFVDDYLIDKLSHYFGRKFGNIGVLIYKRHKSVNVV